MEQGHVHPDVNSFILFAHGQYLTGDSGYAGVPRTIEHNTLLVDGKGQGHEGGHDAWAGMDYAKLNEIRLTDVKLSRAGFDLTGEGAAAYDPKLGLTRFTRHVRLAEAGKVEVSDSMEAAKPDRFTEVLHTDATFTQTAKNSFKTTVGGVVLQATEKFSVPASATSEGNIVMGPGRPGSVDKGTPEARGERVTVTTDQPALRARYTWELTW